MNGVMKVDRRKCDRDIISRMYDIMELIYILNRLCRDEEKHSEQCLLDMVDRIQNDRCSCDKYKNKLDCRYDCPHCKTKDSFIDKIIFYLKSLNEG